jgi:hypothetical protein
MNEDDWEGGWEEGRMIVKEGKEDRLGRTEEYSIR